jgi:hypothetical protein
MWYHRIWLPLCSFTYIAICIFDFILMPIQTAVHNAIVEERIITALKAAPGSEATFASDYEKSTSTTKQWTPLTLQGGGLFHLAFGALLTAGATTRGLAKREEVKGYYGTINGAQVDPPPPPPGGGA